MMYGKVLQGEDLPQSKMTAELVRKVRRLHARKERLKRLLDEKYSHEALAAQCGVHTNTMTKVLTYATWRHVPDDPKTPPKTRSGMGPRKADCEVVGRQATGTGRWPRDGERPALPRPAREVKEEGRHRANA